MAVVQKQEISLDDKPRVLTKKEQMLLLKVEEQIYRTIVDVGANISFMIALPPVGHQEIPFRHYFLVRLKDDTPMEKSREFNQKLLDLGSLKRVDLRKEHNVRGHESEWGSENILHYQYEFPRV